MTYSTLTGSRVAATTLRTTNSIVSLGQSTNASNFGQSQGSYVPTAWYSTLNATFTPTAVTKVSMVSNSNYQLAINGQSTVSSIMLTQNAGQIWTSLSQATGLPSATTTNYSSGAICSLGIYSLLAANGGYLYLSNNNAASYANVNPNTPYAHYKFENNITDSQGNLTLTATGSPTYVQGIVGTNAINFSNTAGGAASTYLRSNYSPGSSFTVSFWFNFQTLPETNNTGAYVICLGNATYNGIFAILYLNLSGYTGFYVQYYTPGGLASLLPATVITTNTWYNITVIMQPLNGMNYVYLNNKLLNSAVSAGLIQPITGLSIGANFVNTANAFNGYIDDLKIYNTAIPFSPMVPANWSNVAISGNAQYMLATAANGGLFMSSNFGSTWQQISSVALQAYWTGLSLSHSGQYMLSSGGCAVTPQLTGLTGSVTTNNPSTTWTVSNIIWTASASSASSGGAWNTYKAFNNINGDGWISIQNSYTNGATNGATATMTILGGIGSVAGEWLQLQASVPLVIQSYSLGNGPDPFPYSTPKSFYIIGSNDGISWYPLQFATNTLTSTTSSGASSTIILNFTGIQQTSGGQIGTYTTTAYSYAITAYSYFRIVSTVLGTGSTYVEIGEWYINFLGGHSYSTNYGQTWNNTLQQSTIVQPQLAGLSGSTWTVNGVTWTLAASSNASFANIMFNTTYSPDSWYPSSLTYTQSGNTSGIYTTIQGIGTIQGDWLQLQSSVPLVISSYQLATGNAGGPHTAKLFYLIGSNDGAIWYPINQSTVAIAPNTGTFTVIPGIIQVNSTAAQPFGNTTLTNTTYSTTTNAYSYFRLLVFSSYSPTGYVLYSEWLINFINAGSNGLITSTFAAPSAIAVSGNGQYAIGANLQTPYVISNYLAGLSTNSYTSPTLTGITANITGAALSYTGQRQVLINSGTTNNLYYSTNYGATFTAISLGSAALVSVTMSYDGSYITASTATTVYTLNSNSTGYSVAVGTSAGQQNQGQNSIAIGSNAGQTNQTANSIVLNAQSTAINANNAGLFVAPVANAYQSTAPSFNVLGYSSQDNQVVQSGVTFTQTAQQQVLYGEWIQLQLATATPITSYTLQQRLTVPTRYPSAWSLLASNDGINWIVLDQQSGKSSTSWGTLYPINTSTTSYYYFRIIITGISGVNIDIGGIYLYNGLIPVFGSYANYTVIQSGLYNILQLSGITVCITTFSWPTTGTITAMGVGGGSSPDFNVYQPGWIVTQNWYLQNTNNFLGFYVQTQYLGPGYEYGTNMIAFQGTNTPIIPSSTTTLSIAGTTTITGPLIATVDTIAQGLYLMPSAANSATILSYFQKVVSTVNSGTTLPPFWQNQYTFGAIIAHGRGGSAFSGGVIASNGNVCMIPTNSTFIGIYNPTNNTYTNGFNFTAGASAAFHGGILLPTGIIIFASRNSPNIGIYNPLSNVYTEGPVHGQGGDTVFIGGILLPNGNALLVPWGSANIGIYTQSSNTYTAGPAHGQPIGAFSGGILLPNGNVVLIPTNSPYIGIYNYLTNTYTNGPAHGQGTNAFSGGALLPNGNVVFVPYVSANIGIYNPTTNTYIQGPSHGQGSAAFIGGALLPSGIVVFSPHGSANIGFYNPYTNTYIQGPAHGQTQYSYYGCTVLPNGNVIFIPWDAANIGILSTSLTSPTDMCMSPYFNKL
jgi:hypothetical protein